MPLKHNFVSAIVDNPVAVAAGKVVSSKWNEDHVLTGVTANGVLFNDNGVVATDVSFTFDKVNDIVLLTDVGLRRAGAGALEVNNGTAGSFRDLMLRRALVAPTTLGTIVDGALEYDGTKLWFTVGTTRNQIVPATGGGSGTPGGATTQIQYNKAGAFAGDSNLVFNDTTKTLSLGGAPRAWQAGQLSFDIGQVGHFRADNVTCEFGSNLYYDGNWRYILAGSGANAYVTAPSGGPASFVVAMAAVGAAGAVASPVNQMVLSGGNLSVVGAMLPSIGTALLPAHSFSLYPNSGMYSFNNNSALGMSIAGTNVAAFTPQQFLFVPGVKLGWTSTNTFSAYTTALSEASAGVLRVEDGSNNLRDFQARNIYSSGRIDCVGNYIAPPAGSAAAPGLVFQGNATTGLYAISSGSISFTYNGVLRHSANGANFLLVPGYKFGWGADAGLTAYGTVIEQTSAGTLQINSGAINDYRDLTLRNLNMSGNISCSTINTNGNTITSGSIACTSISSTGSVVDTSLPNWTIAQAAGNYGHVAYSTSGGAAYMTFHRAGAFASQFGIDTDNRWKVGGWSMGGVSYDVFHAGNTHFATGGNSLYPVYYNGGTVNGGVNLDFNNGMTQVFTINAPTTFYPVNVPVGAIIRIIVNTSGGQPVSWGGSIYWQNGVTPDPAAGSILWCCAVFTAISGTQWLGTLAWY